MDEIFEKVKNIIIEELNSDPSTITKDTLLKEDLHADSIDAVQIIMDLEDTFNIEVGDDEIADIKTVGDLVDYVKKLIK